MMRETEAATLRNEWLRLQAEGVLLATLTERLKGCHDLVALRAHRGRLHDHQMKLHALTKLMESFHLTYGAVGLGL